MIESKEYGNILPDYFHQQVQSSFASDLVTAANAAVTKTFSNPAMAAVRMRAKKAQARGLAYTQIPLYLIPHVHLGPLVMLLGLPHELK